jgi:hypothetical protein
MTTITNQRALRAAFWDAHPTLPRRKIRNYTGTGKMYPTDTRVAWVDFIDYMARDGSISTELANRACLGGDE